MEFSQQLAELVEKEVLELLLAQEVIQFLLVEVEEEVLGLLELV